MNSRRKKLPPKKWRELVEEEAARFEVFSGKVSVNVSGGAASAVVWHRCLQRFGASRVKPVFADTNTEHPDLHRFLGDCERVFGQQVERINDGRDIWDVFSQSGMMRIISAGGACKASIELKQKPLRDHFFDHDADAIAVGIEFEEGERIEAFRNAIPYPVLFPLCARPLLSACEIIAEIEALGIKPPALYDDGYQHNNCGGFCILAGLGQWAANRKRDPEGFEYHRRREQEFMTDHKGFTILRDQRGGESTPYSLNQLAEEQDAGRVFPSDWQSQCSCMEPKLFTVDDCF